MASFTVGVRTRFTAEEVAEMCVRDSNEAGSDIDSEHEGMSSGEESDLDRELLGMNDSEGEMSQNSEVSDDEFIPGEQNSLSDSSSDSEYNPTPCTSGSKRRRNTEHSVGSAEAGHARGRAHGSGRARGRGSGRGRGRGRGNGSGHSNGRGHGRGLAPVPG